MNERERTPLSSSSDLDFFLRLEAFVRPEGLEAVPMMLEEFGYIVREGREHWQFARPLGGGYEGVHHLLWI